MTRRDERDDRILEEYARLSLDVIVTPVRGKLYCDFCAKTRPVAKHEAWCPVLDILAILRRRANLRKASLPGPLDAYQTPSPSFPLERS